MRRHEFRSDPWRSSSSPATRTRPRRRRSPERPWRSGRICSGPTSTASALLSCRRYSGPRSVTFDGYTYTANVNLRGVTSFASAALNVVQAELDHTLPVAAVTTGDTITAKTVRFTCDLILLQLEVPLETVYAAIAFGKRHSVKTVLNPAPAVRDLDMARARDASFLMPNETELAILTSMPVEFEAEVAAAAQSLIGQGFEAVVVTLGARGALVAAREGVRRVAPVTGSTRPAPATPSSAASPATSPLASTSMPPSPKRPATQPIRSPSAARRNPLRPKANSRPFARGSRHEQKAGEARPCGATSALHICARHG